MVAHNLAFSVDKELGKVPWDLLGLLFLCIIQLRVPSEILVDRVCIGSVHFSLSEHGKFGAIELSRKGLNLGVASGLLASELVAGEG